MFFSEGLCVTNSFQSHHHSSGVLITGGPHTKHVYFTVDTILINSQQPTAGYSSSYRHAHRGVDKRKKITIKCRHKVTNDCINYCKVIFKQKD